MSDVEALMEAAIVPGVVGTALAGKECPQGTYPITVAFLKLVNAFVKVRRVVGFEVPFCFVGF